MDLYIHEVAALIFANNVDKGVNWAFEQAKEFMEESDRRVLEKKFNSYYYDDGRYD